MHEQRRAAVTVDMCPRCRGVWLDRGELDELLAARREAFEPHDGPGELDDGPPEPRRLPVRRPGGAPRRLGAFD
jgi:hypothetical protein